jgi:hypothetical protein
MYKIISWRFGERNISECKTLKEAEELFVKMKTWDCFPEYILDDNNIILKEDFEDEKVKCVSKIGETYKIES